MKIKNLEWINFKMKFLAMIDILGCESDKFDLPDQTENFEIRVGECMVNPIFTKKPDFFKVEYDFTLCETQIRTMAFSMYKDAGRIEVTLKNNLNIEEEI